MPLAIPDDDEWVETPQGPNTGENRTSALMRGYLGDVGKRGRWVFNRLVKGLLGDSFQTFESGAIDTVTDQITIPAHGFAPNALLRYGNVSGTAMSIVGAPFPLGTSGLAVQPIWARVVDANTIELAITSGGPAVDITAVGSGTHYLYATPQALDLIYHQAFTTLAGASIPAGSLRTTLTAYMAAWSGGTFTGLVQFVGATARIRRRPTATLANLAGQTVSIAADVYYAATPTAQRDVDVDDTGSADDDEIQVRRPGSGNFAYIFHRPGAPGAIVTLPGNTCCEAILKRRGGVWTLLSYSGNAIPGADAG